MTNLIDNEFEKYKPWINKLLFTVTVTFFVLTICILVIIVALYFFVSSVSVGLAKFITDLPAYQSTVGAIGAVSLAYIYKKYK